MSGHPILANCSANLNCSMCDVYQPLRGLPPLNTPRHNARLDEGLDIQRQSTMIYFGKGAG